MAMADQRFDLFLNDLLVALDVKRWDAERALRYAIQCNRDTYVTTDIQSEPQVVDLAS